MREYLGGFTMEIIERIYQLLDEKEKKAYELCAKLDIRTSTMSTWKARISDPPAKYMKTIADFLGVSLDYLLTGNEAPVRKTTTPEEDDLLSLFRELPENKKYEFVGELKGFLKAYTESQKYVGEGKRLLG
jgi:transcriptional regulator with XRE-family HTH domain